MEISSDLVKAFSFTLNEHSYFLVNKWINGEGIDIHFQDNNNSYTISVSDLIYDDIFRYNLSDKYIVDYDQKFNGSALKHHRLIILKNDTITIRIQNLYGEQVINFSTPEKWNAFISILSILK